MPEDTYIIAATERLFDHTGFSRAGMDKLVAAAGVSSRTLYKRIGNKAALIEAVLRARDARFFEASRPQSIDGLFDALQDWIDKEGARGCLFLRAASEMGDDDSNVAEIMRRHKARTRMLIGDLLAAEAKTNIGKLILKAPADKVKTL